MHFTLSNMKYKNMRHFYNSWGLFMYLIIYKHTLKGQFQGQQTRGERGKKTLPAFAARLLNQQTRGERRECSNKRIRTKNIFKIHMENFNFLFFFFLLTITIHI